MIGIHRQKGILKQKLNFYHFLNKIKKKPVNEVWLLEFLDYNDKLQMP